MIRRTRAIVDSCARNLVHPMGSLTISPVPPRLQAWAMNSGLEDGIFMAHSWLPASSAPYLRLTSRQLRYGVTGSAFHRQRNPSASSLRVEYQPARLLQTVCRLWDGYPRWLGERSIYRDDALYPS
jgi:hypothetical protein